MKVCIKWEWELSFQLIQNQESTGRSAPFCPSEVWDVPYKRANWGRYFFKSLLIAALRFWSWNLLVIAKIVWCVYPEEQCGASWVNSSLEKGWSFCKIHAFIIEEMCLPCKIQHNEGKSNSLGVLYWRVSEVGEWEEWKWEAIHIV